MTEAGERPEPDPLAPYPTLVERDAGTLPEPELYEDVPPHMERHLLWWVDAVLGEEDRLARKLVQRFRMSWESGPDGRTMTDREAIMRVMSGETHEFRLARPVDRLAIVDAIVSLHPCWARSASGAYFSDRDRLETWGRQLAELGDLLDDCGSAWYLDLDDLCGLYRRVDPTATQAWRAAREHAEKAERVKASEDLAQAWRELYGQHPDPSASYSAAVKAVENAALPVVFPDRKEKGKKPTVHKVRDELRDHGSRWRFALAEDDAVRPGHGSVEVVATMLQRFLRGETDRHGDDENRPSKQAEAAAALHLAVVLVQWFVTGAIKPREAS